MIVQTIRRMLIVTLAIVGGLGPNLVSAQVSGGAVAVTVTYTGKGTVDAKHHILVFLFSDPNVTNASEPLAHQAIVENKGTATFKDVTASPVYVFVAYDAQSNYDGESGPPPEGTPVGAYRKAAGSPPLPVQPGPMTAVKISFDDSERWKR